jgi:hypothetical protein
MMLMIIAGALTLWGYMALLLAACVAFDLEVNPHD